MHLLYRNSCLDPFRVAVLHRKETQRQMDLDTMEQSPITVPPSVERLEYVDHFLASSNILLIRGLKAPTSSVRRQ